jgi:NosR/NirI family transcriptional regulator, nitrous oxide reductase regulator
MIALLSAALRAAMLSMLLLAGVAAPALAAEARLAEFLGKIKPDELVAGADRFGPPEGSPPLAPVFQGDRLLGFAYLNSDVVDSTGYSGRPIRILVALDPTGKIIGAKLMEHHEPIVLVGIPEEKIRAVIDHFRGTDIRAIAAGTAQETQPDIVSGATVTVLVIGDSIMRSALKIVQARGLGQPAATVAGAAAPVVTTVDLGKSEIEDWQTLLGDGSIHRLHLSVADINDAYGHSGNAEAAARPEKGPPDDTFVDLYAAPATIPTIGRSLLGEAAYTQMMQGLQPGQQAIIVMGQGRYSFKGSGFVRGGIFDRIELVQGLESVRFHDRNHTRIVELAAAGAPPFKEIGLFVIPLDAHFDAAQPWQVKLLVQRAVGALQKAFLMFDLHYLPPEKYLKHEQPAVVVTDTAPTAQPDTAPATGTEPATAAPAEASVASETPLWQRIWMTRWLDVGILAVIIGALTGIFFFQDWFMRRPRIFVPLRYAFLAVVLVWLGWLVHAQPSVVNVLTYVNAFMSGFKWDYFLMDPLLFILWVGIAAALLFWGRGPFCGWLCPFGALQELTNKAARRLKVPQITVPWGLHERLWPIKYIIFLGLFGISIYSLALGEQLSEIEPFKTAIVLRFVRAWPFVVFAGVLLFAGLFIERFFCRYLCPLGAALAIPGRLRMFDWLKRYRECGSPCQRCAGECPVQAIRPEGQINVNECIYCMHCQLLYWDDHKCPVMIQRRLKRERRAAVTSPTMRPAAAGDPIT